MHGQQNVKIPLNSYKEGINALYKARKCFAGVNITLLLIRAVPALIRRCDDLPATITHVPVAAVLVLNTPDDGRLRPKHVE